jgi:hypothetical protein
MDFTDNFRGDHLHGCKYEGEGDPKCQKVHYAGDLNGACRYHCWKYKEGMYDTVRE